MASFWIQTTTNKDSWAKSVMQGEIVELTGAPPEPTAVAAGTALRSTVPVVRRCLVSGTESWILIVPAGMSIYVNGNAVKTHARLLRDRDAIWWCGISTLYFSTEREVWPELFPGHDLPVYCPRCKQELAKNQLAVECPACGLFHHEDPTAKLECWSYTDVCAGCDRQTGLDAVSWSPNCD